MAKPNKAEKFIKRMFKEGKTRNGVRSAIFEKLNTWNFPPEYEDALIKCDPNFNVEDVGGIWPYLDDYVCDKCGNCHETCFCGEEADPIEEALDEIGHSAEAEQAVFGVSGTNNADPDFKCPGEETVKCQICPQATFCTIITGDSECIFCGKKPCICAVIELPKLPEPGTQKWKDMVDFMRIDMANNMGYSKVIEGARKSIEARGLNFNEEFEKWKEKNVK